MTSLWTRLTEAVAALARGEGLSAVIEAFSTPPERRVAFTIAVIALGAKMAKADGMVTRPEVAAFREVFAIPPAAEADAARLYDYARRDVAGFEAYAAQIARMFGPRAAALRDLLDGLFHIALADGALHPHEDAFLARVAELFGLTDDEYALMRAPWAEPDCEPYAVLGLACGADAATVRARWRQLVRESHPDRMIADGLPEEAVKLATARLARVNAAYERILTGR